MDILGIIALFGVTGFPLILWVNDKYFTEWNYGIWIASLITLIICISVVAPYWSDEDTWTLKETVIVTKVNGVIVTVSDDIKIFKSVYNVPWCILHRNKYNVR